MSKPLTETELAQSETWADGNTCPYPLGRYLETISNLRARAERAELLITHLGSWRDRAGACHDLTNPEAQVQSIIDAKGQAERERDEAQTEARNWQTSSNANRDAAMGYQDRALGAERQLANAQARIAALERVAKAGKTVHDKCGFSHPVTSCPRCIKFSDALAALDKPAQVGKRCCDGIK